MQRRLRKTESALSAERTDFERESREFQMEISRKNEEIARREEVNQELRRDLNAVMASVSFFFFV